MTRNLLSSAFIFLVILIPCALASAQTSGSASAESFSGTAQAASESASRTKADETFDLNIAERRIIERDFAASTSVEVGEEAAQGLLLRVGVSVGAEEINVLLRNVQGHVRFRATLERVLERLNTRRAPGAVP